MKREVAEVEIIEMGLDYILLRLTHGVEEKEFYIPKYDV